MEITSETVRELLHYDPDTGIFTWKRRAEHWFSRHQDFLTWNAKNAGKRAGCAYTYARTGYQSRQMTLLGKRRLEHQVAWVYMLGNPLPEGIDHINQDSTDNRWSNLRRSSYAENNRNVTLKRNNTSGVTGVYWHKRARKWLAQCWFDGVHYYLGLHSDLESAKDAVTTFRASKGFSPRHGAEIAPYRAR